MIVSSAQIFLPPIGGIGSGFGQNSFASQNTNFNQNQGGFGLIAGFGGSTSTNFNQNNVQGGK